MLRGVALLGIAVELLVTAPPAICKCVHNSIYVEGSVYGPAGAKFKLRVEVTPDPNWEPQPDLSVKDGRFKGVVYFDTTKSEGRVRDNCSRVPEGVDVVLLKDGREVDRVHLDASKAFVKDKQHGYKLRKPVMLRSQ